MHFAAACDIEGVGAQLGHVQRDVLQKLPVQTVTQVAGGDVFALAAGEWGIVDGECHLDRRVGDLDERQRLRVSGGTDRAADGESEMPEKATISPAEASWTGVRFRPSNVYSATILPFSIISGS